MSIAIESSQNVGRVVISIDELSKILNRSVATIRTQVSREPSKLPKRFLDGTSSVRWLLRDVWKWQDECSSITPLSTDTSIVRRGAPSAKEKEAAQKLGVSVKQYRACKEVSNYDYYSNY